MAVDGVGDNSGKNDGADDKSSETALTKNEAAQLLASGAADGPPKFALVAAGKGWTIAATGAAGGLVATLGAIAYILAYGDLVRLAGLIAFLGAIAGACATALVTHGRLHDAYNHLVSAHLEIDRKAAVNAQLLGHILKERGTSEPGKQKLPDVLKQQLASGNKPEKKKGGKRT